MRPRLLFCLLLCLLPLRALAAEEVSLPFDHSEWDQFLKKFVNEKGEVNYRAAQKDPVLLDTYLEKLRSFSVRSFGGWPREEQMALLINAFNAGVIRTILHHYPVKTPLEIPGGWNQGVVQVGRRVPDKNLPAAVETAEGLTGKDGSITRSLNQIEVYALRRGFREEKVLFALSYGARGSPRLRQEAYTRPQLEGQLYLATREFVNHPDKNHIVPGEKKIILSRLFQWYGRDFVLNWSNFPEEIKWNPQEMAVLSFMAHYLEDPQKAEYLKKAKYKVKYSVFDWRLNDWNPGEGYPK